MTLELAHFGLRTRDLDRAIEWYGQTLGAIVRFRNDIAAFMSFDDEHHRFVLWDDGATSEKAAEARGVDHIGFACGRPSQLAEQYERLTGLGITPVMAVNHHFTSSLYYADPDGNEVEITCDNYATKEAAHRFMETEEMAAAMRPPFFGAPFDPEALLALHRAGAADEEMARIGIGDPA